MRIVDVCAFYAPRGGGVRTYVDRKLATGPALGHEIVIVAPGPETRTEVRGAGARIEWMASPRFPLDGNYRYFDDPPALHALLDRLRPDMVEASSPWRSASLVGDWPGAAPRALVAHADPLAAYAYRWFGGVADRATIDRGFDWYWRHLRRLDRRFDMIVSASASLSARLAAGGLAKVVTNPLGIQPGLFSHRRRDAALRRHLLASCGLGEEAMLLIGVGRSGAEKRWDMVRDAATAAALETPIGLVLIGTGHDKKARGKRKPGPHIRTLGGIADRERLATLLASADALVHGCESETFCFAAAEAAASGLDLILPDLGGAADIGRAQGGRLYRSGDPAALRTAILAAAADRRAPRDRGAPRTMDDHFSELFTAYARLTDRDAMRQAS